MASNTTTTFIGDIQFKDGDTIRLASQLATVDEVNEVIQTVSDKIDSVDLSSYYTKAESDNKYMVHKESLRINHNETFDVVVGAKFGDELELVGEYHGQQFSYSGVVGNDGDSTVSLDVSISEPIVINKSSDDALGFTLVTLSKANKILASYYTKTECDDKYKLKSDKVDLSSYYTKTECDSKYATKSDATSDNSKAITYEAYCSSMPDDNINIGDPVFRTETFYWKEGNRWVMANDYELEDSMFEVTTSGTYSSFVGIVTQLNSNNNSVTFATHGYYLFNSGPKTGSLRVGDAITYDCTKLSTSINTQSFLSYIGVVVAKVDISHVLMFKH